MSMIIVAEDRFFLEDQRRPRIGYMGRVDRTFARMEEREVKRLKREEYLRSKEHRKRENDELASEEEITNMAAEDEPNLEPLCTPESTKLGSAPIVTSELSAALDRANASNRIARGLGHEIGSLNVSYESIRKARLKFPKPTAQSEKASFDPSVLLL